MGEKTEFQKRQKGFLRLDAKDRALLAELTKNARTPYTQLAKKIGLSKDAARYRIKRYEQSGLIRKYLSLIDLRPFGYSSYHFLIQIERKIEEKTIKALAALPFVRSIIQYSGRYDLQIAIVARTIDELNDAEETISSFFSPQAKKELIILAHTITTGGVPDNLLEWPEKSTREAKLDELDKRLLERLANDARAPLHSLKLGVSTDTIVYRLRKLKKAGVFIGAVPALDWSCTGKQFFMVLLQVSADEKQNIVLTELIKNDKHVVWGVKALGPYNLLLYVTALDARAVHKLIKLIREFLPDCLRKHDILLGERQYKFTYLPEGLPLD